MTEHTPGPWKCDSSRVHTSIETNEGLHIAMVSYGNVTMEKHLANARLIAAAPELLEALEYYIDNGDDHKAIDKARAAIAKAKGETENDTES